jgi:hypothetical protein
MLVKKGSYHVITLTATRSYKILGPYDYADPRTTMFSVLSPRTSGVSTPAALYVLTSIWVALSNLARQVNPGLSLPPRETRTGEWA